MHSEEDARYWLRLVRGFLQEAEQDYELRRWRSCVSRAKMSVEHAARAILALFGPVARMRQPGIHLRNLIESKRVVGAARDTLGPLVKTFESIGAKERWLVRDGDEATHRDPWSLFSEQDAHRALEAARQCVSGAGRIFEEFPR